MTRKPTNKKAAKRKPEQPVAPRRRRAGRTMALPGAGEGRGGEEPAPPGASTEVAAALDAAEAEVVSPFGMAIADAVAVVRGDHLSAAVFRALRRTRAMQHLDFLDAVVRGEVQDVYSTMVGPVFGPPALRTRIMAYNALTKGLDVNGDEGTGEKPRRAIIMYPAKDAPVPMEVTSEAVPAPATNGNGRH